MRLGVASRNLLLFLVMAGIWGSTWIPMKVCVGALPPVLFAGVRFIPAGLLLLICWRCSGDRTAIAPHQWPRLLAISLLMVVVAYALMFWAMQYVRSGMAAVIDFTATPVFLLGFAVAMREETFHRHQAVAIALGGIGLIFLFWTALTGHSRGPQSEVLGAAGVVGSVVAYCWGSVLARPLLRSHSSFFVGGITSVIGGVVLLALSLGIEPGALDSFQPQRWTTQVWLGWAFLVLFGTVIASTIFLILLREWGPSRAGAYAFVSPVIAVGLGMAVLHERLGLTELVGVLLMMTATFMAVRPAPVQQR